MSEPTYPIPDGIAVGDFWVNRNNPQDAAFVIAIKWGPDKSDWDRKGWIVTFQWLSGERNEFSALRWLHDGDGWRRHSYSYVRMAWLDED